MDKHLHARISSSGQQPRRAPWLEIYAARFMVSPPHFDSPCSQHRMEPPGYAFGVPGRPIACPRWCAAVGPVWRRLGLPEFGQGAFGQWIGNRRSRLVWGLDWKSGGWPFDQDPRVSMESRVIKSGPLLGDPMVCVAYRFINGLDLI
jgi:hypothetical protein